MHYFTISITIEAYNDSMQALSEDALFRDILMAMPFVFI